MRPISCDQNRDYQTIVTRIGYFSRFKTDFQQYSLKRAQNASLKQDVHKTALNIYNIKV